MNLGSQRLESPVLVGDAFDEIANLPHLTVANAVRNRLGDPRRQKRAPPQPLRIRKDPNQKPASRLLLVLDLARAAVGIRPPVDPTAVHLFQVPFEHKLLEAMVVAIRIDPIVNLARREDRTDIQIPFLQPHRLRTQRSMLDSAATVGARRR